VTARTFSIMELVSDPDGMLKEARDLGPTVNTEVGAFVVRHAAVRELAQSDDRVRPNFTGLMEGFGITSGPFYEWMKISPLDMEREEHKVWRQVMTRAFTPRSVEGLKPFLRNEANRLIDALLPLGRCDFVEVYARKLPAAGLCELVGVPHQDRERFSGWADTIGLGFNVMMLPMRIAEIDDAITQLLNYADELVQARRREPKEDLVTRIAQAVAEQGGLNEAVIRGSIAGLVFAGHETTKNQLGWMVAVLSDVPHEWDRVAKEPERAKDVIEEVLRFRSTATSFGRLAMEDLELFGTRIPRGSTVIGSLWSANRDASVFPKPDQFAVDENRVGAQLAFGQGAHHCLGAALARAELQESLIALTQRMQCPTLEPGAEFLPPIGINGPTKLPISFKPR
jgi:hypothetical protein